MIVGGAGTIWGVVAGAFIFTILPEFLRLAGGLRLVIYGFILLLSIHLIPEGIGGMIRNRMKEARDRSMSLLEIHELTKKYYGLVAVNRVSLAIEDGEVVGLIGPNGSGKTTLFDCITKFTEPSGGRIFFKGREITREGSHAIVLAGLVRTFQQARISPG